jgi:hypothetical protein
MEVHHHSHTPRQKWTHYFWEFLMLFLAVFCGFMAENIREHYIERQRVKQYAFSLVRDLEKDTGMVSIVIRRIDLNIRLTDSLSAYLKNKTLSEIRNIDIFILSSIDRYPPYSWTRATIDQIKNSGSLRYFSNKEIISRISAYDAFTHHMDEDQQTDDLMANSATQARNRIIDMDYSKEFIMGLRNNIDSVIKTDQIKRLILDDRTPLIAQDKDEIRIFLNEKINIRKHLMVRADEELPRLKKDAQTLILLLKKEYHID